ncbi:hypothetical protein LAZ40_05555 [Cereibacter sphaeroides]|uniref:hypothetical protein n=1 Tax=Cereibacter sphaeroides TaxID=1063 RepID=UPI001F32F686|nr:hypothetical protein [Cereibacter sphaeroides]MCE6958515.1 hypothetical protein [Cereibacter sphaeroides]MCE6972823.1 hypothetical protein [Cereibacter sphaeroides]
MPALTRHALDRMSDHACRRHDVLAALEPADGDDNAIRLTLETAPGAVEAPGHRIRALAQIADRGGLDGAVMTTCRDESRRDTLQRRLRKNLKQNHVTFAASVVATSEDSLGRH